MRKSEKEALQAMLDDEQETIKALEKAYHRAIRRIDNHIRILESDEMTQSKIYQKRYQEAMKAQINAALDELHKKSNQTIEEYLTRSYQHGYVGTMYTLHKQGMPILAPIDQRAVTRAVRTDSKLSGRLYGELGVDMQKLKKTIRREISIGISIGSDYGMIARQVQISSGIPLKRAKTIVRTEGHRIQQQSADDARNAAKGQGCQVVKQWDAVLDGNTRTDHRILDGQIREVGEPFEIDGKKAEYPGAFGRPEEDCNCRCVALTRAKWALDADELQTMKDRAQFFGLDKTENFREFEEKYLNAGKTIARKETLWYNGNAEMRQGADELRKQFKPISDTRFEQLTIEARKNGAVIIRGTPEVEAHLEAQGASAATLGEVLLFRSDAMLCEVLEETRHYKQNLLKMNDDKPAKLRIILNEIEAKSYIIDNASKYGVPRNEVELIQKQLESYQSELIRYLQEGAEQNGESH